MSAHELIVQRIRERGPMTVAEFMSLALYHPEHGYYARSARRTGRTGDFFTSVDVGPLFGELLCRQFAEMRERLADEGPFDLVEAGASNGQLARDVLDAARSAHPEFYAAVRLHLVESSPAARAAHAATLGPHAAKLDSSSARLPNEVHGVVFANELLDALPVHRVSMTAGGLREHYVDLMGDRLVERLGAPSNDAIERHLDSLGVRLEPGWRAEVNLAALAWTARAVLALHRGYLLLIDYGYEARDLYSAARATGTLATFERHRSEPERAGGTASWLQAPGTRDITSHVDLTSIRRTAEELGCRTLGVIDQTYFLLALGLDEPDVAERSPVDETRRRLALRTLMLPGGLGSTHKVMGFAKNVAGGLRGFSGPARLT